MSGISPISAALFDAALTLGFPVEILQAQLNAGDVLSATVLPPQNGQDLIEILGQQVAAHLPPSVHPGDVLLLRVTGFAGNQVLVENLGLGDPENPPAALPQSPQTVPAQTATLTTIRPAEPQQSEPSAPPSAPHEGTVTPSTARPPVAPPSAVFVAASVRNAANARGAAEPAPLSTRDTDPVEARIAASQTAKSPAAPIPPAVLGARVQSAVQAAVKNAAEVVTRTIRNATDAIKILRLPDTPVVRTAAAIAPQAAARLPAVLTRLDAALPSDAIDPRIATLRTLIAFVGRMNPQNDQTLAAQISSYVSHVLEGGESKLAQLLEAAGDTAPPNVLQTPHVQHDQTRAPQVQQQPLQTAVHARVAERTAAIDHDLKSLVLSLLRTPPPQRTPALWQALNETLITLTGAQIDVLSNSTPDANSYAFAVPVFFYEGGKPAQLRVNPDGAGGSQRLDADNFHVAFVLDTAHLGTVAIDLQTIGRAVTIDVKTERQNAAAQFSNTLTALRSRLEDLRYRVSSAVAGVAVRPPVTPAADKPAVQPGYASGLDLRA